MKKLLLLIFCLITASASLHAQKKTRILFLLDGSGSMYAKMQTETRIAAAKRLLSNMVDSLRHVNNVELALRIYGHRSPSSAQDCKDTRLEVPFSPNNYDEMLTVIRELTPKGTTLIAYSLQEAAYDFPKEDGVRNVIILITDGLEECSGDPCAVSEALQRQGVILKPFIIGVGGDPTFINFYDCVGRYFDASTESEFENILGVVVSQAINETTCQVNLLDINGRALETNVNMTFYDQKSKRPIHNFIHTMNDRGVPDTLTVDPSFIYDIQVHTVPPVFKNNVTLIPGRHNIIAIDAPQGQLSLQVDGVTAYPDLQAIVRKHGTMQTLIVQEFNATQKFIVGKYDLEILTLPRLYINVSVEQSKNTIVNIPQPGKLHLMGNQEYFGAIYQMKGNMLEWVCDIDDTQKRQILTLQPGKYKVIYRAKRVTKTYMTVEKIFEIQSGGSTHLNLF
ncbi:MAG: VWA domain-containing protein [Bacteroidetes bacterium]|nr:VWA domain-containing protein [Bacteroidota bacterium]